jgi:hypothetical protein
MNQRAKIEKRIVKGVRELQQLVERHKEWDRAAENSEIGIQRFYRD